MKGERGKGDHQLFHNRRSRKQHGKRKIKILPSVKCRKKWGRYWPKDSAPDKEGEGKKERKGEIALG